MSLLPIFPTKVGAFAAGIDGRPSSPIRAQPHDTDESASYEFSSIRTLRPSPIHSLTPSLLLFAPTSSHFYLFAVAVPRPACAAASDITLCLFHLNPLIRRSSLHSQDDVHARGALGHSPVLSRSLFHVVDATSHSRTLSRSNSSKSRLYRSATDWPYRRSLTFSRLSRPTLLTLTIYVPYFSTLWIPLLILPSALTLFSPMCHLRIPRPSRLEFSA